MSCLSPLGGLGEAGEAGVKWGGKEAMLGAHTPTRGALPKSYLTLLNPPMTISRWIFLTQQNFPTRHKSCPDGVLVMPFKGRGRYLDPKQIPSK